MNVLDEVAQEDLATGYCGEPRLDQAFPEAAQAAFGRKYGWSEGENPIVAVMIWPFESAEPARQMMAWMRSNMTCSSYERDASNDPDDGQYLTVSWDVDFETYGSDVFTRRFLIRLLDNPFFWDLSIAIDVVAVRERNIVVVVSSGWIMYDGYTLDDEYASLLTETTDAFMVNTLYYLRNGK